MSDSIRPADLEETELARVDLIAHQAYGRDESTWMPWHWRGYFDAITAVHREFKEAA
jgi:hypothetical protein